MSGLTEPIESEKLHMHGTQVAWTLFFGAVFMLDIDTS